MADERELRVLLVSGKQNGIDYSSLLNYLVDNRGEDFHFPHLGKFDYTLQKSEPHSAFSHSSLKIEQLVKEISKKRELPYDAVLALGRDREWTTNHIPDDYAYGHFKIYYHSRVNSRFELETKLGSELIKFKNRQRERSQSNDVNLKFWPDDLEYLIIDIEDLSFPNLDDDPPDIEPDISALNFFLHALLSYTWNLKWKKRLNRN